MIKTHQTAAKRFRVTRRGKVMKRRAGQDHGNAQESGKVTTAKRRSVSLNKANVRNIRTVIGK